MTLIAFIVLRDQSAHRVDLDTLLITVTGATVSQKNTVPKT